MVFLILWLATGWAADDQPELATKIEAFSASHGAIIIKSFKAAGTLTGLYGTTAEVTACRFFNPQSGDALAGVRIEVKETERITHTSYLDEEELPALMKGLDYIATFNPTLQPFPVWEVDYATKGDLVLTTFNRDGQVMFAIQSGKISSATAFFQGSYIVSFKALLDVAKNALANLHTP